MKKYLAALFTGIILIQGLFGQSFSWIDGEETGYQMNPAMVNYTVTVSSDNTIWFAGMKQKITSYHEMMGDQFLIQYDQEGNRLEEYLIQGSLLIYSMEGDKNENIYISGEYIDENLLFWDGTVLLWDGNSLNGFLAKVTTGGEVAWTVNLNESFGSYTSVTDMRFWNGNIYLAHQSWPTSYVSTISPQGNFTVLLEQTNAGIASGLDIDSQGNIYVTGSCSGTDGLFNGVNFPSPFTYSKYLIKYNKAGDPQWIRFIEDVTCIHPRIRVDREDYIYWLGSLNGDYTIDTIQMLGPTWVYDFYLARFNPSGDVQWAREVPQVVIGDASEGKLQILCVMKDNSVIFAGITRGEIDWGEGVVTQSYGLSTDLLLINYNSDGIVQWAKTGGGINWEQVNCTDIDDEGNLYTTGVGNDTILFDGLMFYRETFYYPFLVKLETETATGIDLPVATTFSIIPNPVKRDFMLTIPSSDIRNLRIIATDGRTVYQTRYRNSVNVETLTPGIYFIQLTLTDGGVLIAKMLKD